MKKFLSILLVLSILCGSAFAVTGLFSLEGSRDDELVTVCITLNEEISAENATMLQGELYYDPEVLMPVSVTAGDDYRYLTCVISQRQPRVQFSHADENSLPLTLASGTVITARFQALTDGDAELRLELALHTADGTVVADLTEYATIAYIREPENPFRDVPEDSFYYQSVLWAVENGITNGATENTFNPGGDLLRAQVVVMLWRAAGSPEPTNMDNPFTDVKDTDFYCKAVLWAVEKGITNGTSATTFGPMGVTNRAQVVTFLWRYLGQPGSSVENPFSDVDANAWYGPSVLWAVENGITNGMSATQFGVGTNCNRAHMVTFLYRALN